MEYSAGFLIVKTFERMYREYRIRLEKYRQDRPRIAHGPKLLEQMPGKYRGVARDPFEPWNENFRGMGLFDEPTKQERAANLFLNELCESGKAEGFFIFAMDDARKIFDMILPPVEREIIWARRVDRDDPPPPETTILGYEPIDFYGDFSSLIAGVAFFLRSLNPTIDDPDGMRARIHYARLNQWGLFNKPDDAHKYVDSFPLLPEHERPKHIVEVRSVDEN